MSDPAAGEGRHFSNWLERAVAGISLLLLVAVIAYLVWEGLAKAGPPEFEWRTSEVSEVAGAHHVRLEVTNVGGSGARHLDLRAEVRDRDVLLAEADASLEWLPSSSSRQTVVILPVDPREHALEVVFVGYEIP